MLDSARIKGQFNGPSSTGIARSCIPYRQEAEVLEEPNERLEHKKNWLPVYVGSGHIPIENRLSLNNIRPIKLECRLLHKDYTVEQANARCMEIHGTTFAGRYVSGRYFCYWSYV